VFVSHDMGAIRRFCTKAVYVKEGKLIKAGTPAEIADLYAEENISKQDSDREKELNLSSAHDIQAEIVNQDKNSIEVKIAYTSRDKEEMYIGLAVTKDGMSIGEINTLQHPPLIGNGEVFYTFRTDLLNPGAYQIAGVSLFKLSNRELLAINKRSNGFAIKGSDSARGAALKLEDTWQYDKN